MQQKLKQRLQLFIFIPVARAGREKLINLLRLECKLEKPNQQVKVSAQGHTVKINSLNGTFSP